MFILLNFGPEVLFKTSNENKHFNFVVVSTSTKIHNQSDFKEQCRQRCRVLPNISSKIPIFGLNYIMILKFEDDSS